MVRRALASGLALICLSAMAGCDGGADGTAPTPTSSGSPTSATSTPTSTPTVPAYLEKYDEDERAAYHAAVDAYDRFADRNAQLFRVGKATPAAKAYYKRVTSDWQSYWAKLQDFESRGIRVLGRGKVIKIRPATIRVDRDGGGQVDLRVCGIATGVRVLQNGTELPQPTPKPTITRVRMVQLPDENRWRILFDRVGGSC